MCKIMFCAVLATFVSLGRSAPPAVVLDITPFSLQPSIHAVGIQFTRSDVFINDGARRFLLTQDGGQTWSNLLVRADWPAFGRYEDVKLYYYNRGRGVLYFGNAFYSTEDGKRFIKRPIKALKLRGQDGYRIEHSDIEHQESRMLMTTNGGVTWADLKCHVIPFDRIANFDKVTTNLIYACVSAINAEERLNHKLVRSVDGGSTWTEVCQTDVAPGIWSTHLFFLNQAIGWISSDRDEGLFSTVDGGKYWRKTNTPERIVCGIFFKNSQRGRIIGGVDMNVYETVDGGNNWRKLSQEELHSGGFLTYFLEAPIARWNDFAVLHTIHQVSRSHQ